MSHSHLLFISMPRCHRFYFKFAKCIHSLNSKPTNPPFFSNTVTTCLTPSMKFVYVLRCCIHNWCNFPPFFFWVSIFSFLTLSKVVFCHSQESLLYLHVRSPLIGFILFYPSRLSKRSVQIKNMYI